MSITIGQIDEALQEWAPSGSAQSYDNVGLQIGRMTAEVTRCLIALDLTPDVVREAQEMNAECVITHHPLLFRPLKSLTDSGLVSSMALNLAESGIGLYAIHTNLDAARDGVSFELARTLGLERIEFLSRLEGSTVKLILFVPIDHIDGVRDAVFSGGAGKIGKYSECSFSHGGTATFKPGEGTKPFEGEASGPRESVNEIRLEVEVARWALPSVLDAAREAHPYEEMVHDIVAVEQDFRNAGIGAVGNLPAPIKLSVFLNEVCQKLENPGIRYAGHPDSTVQKVAVCGGAGADFIGLAHRVRADVYVTSDISYHRYFDVMGSEGDIEMALVDTGHYESERMTESLLVVWLRERFPEIEWIRTKHRTSPVQTWIAT
jgi:dinuclear metal center YbgI/SA1388 family protein